LYTEPALLDDTRLPAGVEPANLTTVLIEYNRTPTKPYDTIKLGIDAVGSRNSMMTECADCQTVEVLALGQVSHRAPRFRGADSIKERDDADAGGLGGLDQPAAGGRDRSTLFAKEFLGILGSGEVKLVELAAANKTGPCEVRGFG
jgi:hypothetical protein